MNINYMSLAFCVMMIGVLSCGCAVGTDSDLQPKQLKMVQYDGGFFSLSKPTSWQIYTAGSCATFAFLVRDEDDPLHQVFYFGEVAPFYMNEEQKQFEIDYVSMGGYPNQWLDMPVVDPLTPENFLVHWNEIVRTSLAQEFMPQAPPLDYLQIISASPTSSTFPVPGSQTKLIRALFTYNGRLGEGLFLVTTAPFAVYGAAFQFIGITSPQGEFEAFEDSLVKIVQSFTISSDYARACMLSEGSNGGAGKILDDTSDIIMEGWEQRNKVDDITSQKRSDSILDIERVYDPDTSIVYEAEGGFYDQYDINRDAYEMNDLQLLPDDSWELWTAPGESGESIH